jgi:hypothetical protein
MSRDRMFSPKLAGWRKRTDGTWHTPYCGQPGALVELNPDTGASTYEWPDECYCLQLMHLQDQIDPAHRPSRLYLWLLHWKVRAGDWLEDRRG